MVSVYTERKTRDRGQSCVEGIVLVFVLYGFFPDSTFYSAWFHNPICQRDVSHFMLTAPLSHWHAHIHPRHSNIPK